MPLLIVATPIGNLSDMSLRAVETLKEADAICCEDTRRTMILLEHLGIKKQLISLHEHNEASRSDEIVMRVLQGDNIALVSDAGHPLINDPGERLIQRCIAASADLTVIPGACSIATALSGAGLPVSPYYFGGFLPIKSGQRLRELTTALARECTSVFFESPHRIEKTLAALTQLDAERRVVVARELTKKFEEYRRGKAQELYAHYQKHPAKGEITLLIAGNDLPKYMGW